MELDIKDEKVVCPFCGDAMSRMIILDIGHVVYACSCPEYLVQERLIIETFNPDMVMQ